MQDSRHTIKFIHKNKCINILSHRGASHSLLDFIYLFVCCCSCYGHFIVTKWFGTHARSYATGHQPWKNGNRIKMASKWYTCIPTIYSKPLHVVSMGALKTNKQIQKKLLKSCGKINMRTTCNVRLHPPCRKFCFVFFSPSTYECLVRKNPKWL